MKRLKEAATTVAAFTLAGIFYLVAGVVILAGIYALLWLMSEGWL